MADQYAAMQQQAYLAAKNQAYQQAQTGLANALGGLGGHYNQQQQAAAAQAQQQAIQKALAAMSARAMPDIKKEPKNEFLEKVRKIYMKKMELRLRLAGGIGGILAFILCPMLGFQIYRLWSWCGAPSPIGEIGGLLVGICILIFAVLAVIFAINGDMARAWARDLVLEREQK